MDAKKKNTPADTCKLVLENVITFLANGSNSGKREIMTTKLLRCLALNYIIQEGKLTMN